MEGKDIMCRVVMIMALMMSTIFTVRAKHSSSPPPPPPHMPRTSNPFPISITPSSDQLELFMTRLINKLRAYDHECIRRCLSEYDCSEDNLIKKDEEVTDCVEDCMLNHMSTEDVFDLLSAISKYTRNCGQDDQLSIKGMKGRSKKSFDRVRRSNCPAKRT